MHYYAYTKYCTWAGYQDVDTKTVLILSNFLFYTMELCQLYASTGCGPEDLFQILSQHICQDQNNIISQNSNIRLKK